MLDVDGVALLVELDGDGVALLVELDVDGVTLLAALVVDGVALLVEIGIVDMSDVDANAMDVWVVTGAAVVSNVLVLEVSIAVVLDAVERPLAEEEVMLMPVEVSTAADPSTDEEVDSSKSELVKMESELVKTESELVKMESELVNMGSMSNVDVAMNGGSRSAESAQTPPCNSIILHSRVSSHE